MPEPEEIDTTNRFGVGFTAGRVVIMKPLPPALTLDDAINLAAHLAVAADSERFAKVLEALEQT